MCTHGYKRTYKASSARPVQRVNYTGCLASFNINEQVDGTWKIGVKVVLEHNHEIGPYYYHTYSFNKKVTDEDVELLKLLDTANAPPRKMAEVITQRTGESYNSKDVKNLLTKVKKKETEVDGLEKHLDEVRRNGGTVLVDKDKKTGYVNAMLVQTKEMKDMLSRVKPTVFENDTTFGTNSQGYKLFVPVYHNTISDKTDIGALVFLATETRENIVTGVNFLKDVLDYAPLRKYIFFVDKARRH